MVFCILGPNGAGKTTLISILAGLLYPDAGEGQVWGLDLLKQRRKIRTLVNIASGHANLPDNFTADEILNYFGMLYGLPKKDRRRKTEELLLFFELVPHRKVPFKLLGCLQPRHLGLEYFPQDFFRRGAERRVVPQIRDISNVTLILLAIEQVKCDSLSLLTPHLEIVSFYDL